MKKLFSTTCLLILTINAFAQSAPEVIPDPRLTDAPWTSSWIAHPDGSPYDFGVYHFRKDFELNDLPDQLVINVSADNRYQLFVNGKQVSEGPAKGDLLHYHYETIDIAPYLRPGKNCLAAVVWNFGIRRPVAQMSFRTAFLMQANEARFDYLNSGQGWKTIQNKAYTLLPAEGGRLHTYLVTGPRIHLDAGLYPWGWETLDYDDHAWISARNIGQAHPSGRTTEFNWELVPRPIPAMELEPEEAPVIRRSSLDQGKAGILFPIHIPSHSKCTLLLDQKHLTNAYPHLLVSGGSNSLIRIEYAESLFDANGKKGNRNEIDGKEIKGYYDEFSPDGQPDRLFTTLWFRTWRYVQLTIETGDMPLDIHSFNGIRRTYPFKSLAEFNAPVENLEKLWEVGWRTARLCAGDTYYDCPYYEQLQYVGDTRIQALISLYMTGDDRLMRNAIQQFADSRYSDGLTKSRYPDLAGQVIPTYSLFWINMVHDYWMLRPDSAFVRRQLSTVKTILEWYEAQMDVHTGLIGNTNYWNFVDWSAWPGNGEKRFGGVPPLRGGSSVLTLQWVYALQDAMELMAAFGQKDEKAKFQQQIEQAKQAVWKYCWDPARKLVSDTPEKTSYSQHGNIWAVLTHLIPQNEESAMVDRIVQDTSLIQATFYFRFYLMQALYQTGLGNRYLDELKPWFDMLDIGLTTFAEKPDPTRSDCHAWSASPNYDLLATVAGIRPGASGFRRVLINPSPGNLDHFDATAAHPNGIIQVMYRRSKTVAEFEINLPEGTPGQLNYLEQSFPLHPGKQTIQVQLH
ncbi:MAG TPA: alpha-L-rhamnosidase C-terminal domain-containing protein [Saprospiraceae bacterium]|nr:alpha-L-rhamnosidase C-terminal domain-containing protein [Saprospiraceae bacterium]